ncbi:CapA family protein [Alkalicoccus halolimnae]|uniref:CapA family protein n=1 Tax=Alkalicoccus halolimnae TaxID=1667239 RepID=A0A5C7F4C6_9BACI|nr:CapA family protein [Alkalicoccus halolimnae]TXF85511.1 CapA family protein [Alkalicoccus halolimnae]
MKKNKQSWNRKERHLDRMKRHKKHSLRDSVITLVLVIAAVAVYQLLPSGQPGAAPVDTGADEELSISLTGDMMLGRFVENLDEEEAADTFAEAKPLFEETDLVTGNFENPVVNGDLENYEEDSLDKSVKLHTGPESVKKLKDAGFTNVNLANNHLSDYGTNGVFDTLETFNEQELETVGAGINIDEAREVQYEEVNGLTVATLGFNDAYMTEEREATTYQEGVVPMKAEYFVPDIREAEANADVVIVHAHWGEEYDNSVHPRQRELAHAMVEAGADVIAGHHPHVLQPIEVHDDAVIAYSLGNFVFDQGWSMTKETAVLQYRLSEEEIKLEIHPMYIEEAQPRQVTNRYRQDKIYSQLTEEFIYGSSFTEEWDREDDKLTKTIER